MAGVATDESELGRSFEGFSSGQQPQLCQSGEVLAEWRSSEQVENGSPSTSLLSWDSDEDDGGLKPSDLYGKYTWKIDKFSQINKRELRSNAFEVGGFKWYILIYPQGCDVCNHLSVFLCVANHDKLLPGWSHFAQFTIAVVNKDPKKSKYSDTLHRFWKKEHDWGWKKFMELSKVLDGFLDDDTLIIKAQVQVIRERTDRPFRCLDHQYWRELVRVYLTNVEQICRRFVEERRGKLVKLIDDKPRWSSFCSFWLGMDQSSRRRMSQEKTELILRVIVKHFFIEKEVTSTLVMDALYSGLKVLKGQNKGKKNKGKFLEAEELPIPIVSIEKDTFVLIDDVLLLLGRAAMEPLPPKDDKGPQNRTKDGTGEEFNKDLLERDERQLTELGRRTIEIFVLAHIFSKIEVAYQEAVALKKQEELIREEEAAWLAELEQKAKRGAPDKEKKSKKKQGKQKRNNRKGKDKGKDDKMGSSVQDKVEQDRATDERKDSAVEPVTVSEKCNAVEDVSDVSDSVDCVPDTLGAESEDRAASPVKCELGTMLGPPAEVSSIGASCISGLQNGVEGRSLSLVDDSSSTCSSDSVPSVVMHRGISHHHKNQKSPRNGHNQQCKPTSDRVNWATEDHSLPSESVAVRSLAQAVRSSQDQVLNGMEQHVEKKEEETDSLHKNSQSKIAVDREVSADGVTCRISPPQSPSKSIPSLSPPKPNSKICTPSDAGIPKEQPSDNPKVDNTIHMPNSARNKTLKPDAPIFMTAKSAAKHPTHVGKEKLQAQDVTVLTAVKNSNPPLIPSVSRPLSAPLVPGPKPPVSVTSMVQTAPALSRSVSAAGRLGPEVPAASATPSSIPQSYRNAMMGVSAGGSSPTYSQNHSANSVVNPLHSYSPEPALLSTQLFSPRSSDRMDSNLPIKPSLSFGMASHHNNMLQNSPLWIEQSQRDSVLSLLSDHGSLVDNRSINFCNSLPSEFPPCTSGEEFPHLDIINDLLDDEHGIGFAARVNSRHQNFTNGPHSLNRHYSFPADPTMSSVLGTLQSSCRFDRTHSYHNDLRQHGYGIPGRAYDTLGDMVLQSSSQPYGNGLSDGYQPSQWQIPSSDMAFWGIRHTDDISGFTNNMPEYQNVNGYMVFRQPNGL